jgi:hypothetical protein
MVVRQTHHSILLHLLIRARLREGDEIGQREEWGGGGEEVEIGRGWCGARDGGLLESLELSDFLLIKF